jgi:hypothetical protein
MSSQGDATIQREPIGVGSSALALQIAVPIMIGVVLIIAILLMPRGFFASLLSKVGFSSNKDGNSTQLWYGRQTSHENISSNEKFPQKTFVERHLETLRAWQKPDKQAQPPLPLYLNRPDTIRQPRQPIALTYQQWLERQRNTTMRSNPMIDFQLS